MRRRGADFGRRDRTLTPLRLSALSAALSVAVAAAPAVVTAQTAAGLSPSPDHASTKNERTQRLSKMVGADIRDRRAEKLGEVEDVIVDVHSGQLTYAVVVFHGISPDKFFAVPWHSLQMEAGGGAFVIDVEGERLRQAPSFDPENWPNMADPRWNTELQSYYAPAAPRSAR